MNFLGKIAGESIKGILGGVGTLAKDIRTALTGKEPMTAEQAQAIVDQAHELEMASKNIETMAMAGQIDLNKLDAQSDSLFKSGWRPALGWCCVSGLIYTFLIKPLLPWLIQVGALIMSKTVVLPSMPTLDTGELLGLVATLLGVAGYRSFEKAKGVASK